MPLHLSLAWQKHKYYWFLWTNRRICRVLAIEQKINTYSQTQSKCDCTGLLLDRNTNYIVSEYICIGKGSHTSNPYSPGHPYVSSANRDRAKRLWVGEPSTGIRMHMKFEYVVIDCQACISVTYLLHVNYVIRNYDLLDFLMMESYQNEATTKKSPMFEDILSVQHDKDGRQVERADTWSHYKTNRPLLTYFQLITMIRNYQKCFILHSVWGSNRLSAAILN